jgi:hypothetical protein
VVGFLCPPTGLAASATRRLGRFDLQVNSYLLTFVGDCVLVYVECAVRVCHGESDVARERVCRRWSALRGVTGLQLRYNAVEREAAAAEQDQQVEDEVR